MLYNSIEDYLKKKSSRGLYNILHYMEWKTTHAVRTNRGYKMTTEGLGTITAQSSRPTISRDGDTATKSGAHHVVTFPVPKPPSAQPVTATYRKSNGSQLSATQKSSTKEDKDDIVKVEQVGAARAKQISNFRDKYKITQVEFARGCGVAANVIAAWESGKTPYNAAIWDMIKHGVAKFEQKRKNTNATPPPAPTTVTTAQTPSAKIVQLV